MNKLRMAIGIIFILSLISVPISIGLAIHEFSKTRAGQQVEYWLSDPNESEVTNAK
jgi:hypothetical protein